MQRVLKSRSVFLAAPLLLILATVVSGDELDRALAKALDRAGDNREAIATALQKAPPAQQTAMRFLVAHMPQRDLQSLSSEFLLENVEFAYRAWKDAPWKDSVSEAVFLNNILPYANITEKRDNWRKDFYTRFKPLVAEAKSASEAAAMLNQKIFPLLKVRYSTKRNRADQGPYESIETGLASCTGLSILLIDACRAVGVPARFVGTPLWADRSGNHSWVEVWDGRWRFTGAAEPTGLDLDKAWFLGRASKADRKHRLHAIYAVSYRKTPQAFPMVWAREENAIHAVNVTDRYTSAAKKLPEGWARIMFQALGHNGNRCCAAVQVRDQDGKVIFQGDTNDERFDRNDHVTAELKLGANYRIEFQLDDQKVAKEIRASKDGQVITVELEPDDKSATPAPKP